ncbi:MAG: formylglycine-generating enzyme family protein [Gemmatimonadota bacterium]
MQTHLLLLLALSSTRAAATNGAVSVRNNPAKVRAMATIPAGNYRPLFTSAGRERVRIAAFRLDRVQVTRGDFADFVATHPQWRRSDVPAAQADAGYLSDWSASGSPGTTSERARPVSSVSWFAARAYCEAQGKRLPTVDEWEYVAAADETRRDASDDPVVRNRILALTAARGGKPPVAGRGAPNVYGVRDLHGVVWEWTQEYNGIVQHASHGAAGMPLAHDLYCAGGAIGASDPSNYPAFARFSVRGGLTRRSTSKSVGFRCAAKA